MVLQVAYRQSLCGPEQAEKKVQGAKHQQVACRVIYINGRWCNSGNVGKELCSGPGDDLAGIRMYKLDDRVSRVKPLA
jgi:hypothetical protein